MSDLWIVALPLLFLDLANPMLLAAMVICMTGDRPYVTALALLVGHMLAYALCGLLIIYGLAEPLERVAAPVLQKFNNPRPEDFVIGFILGLVFLWVAFRWRKAPPHPSEKSTETPGRGPVSAFFFGTVVNFVGLPFAVPYFAFLNQLMKLEGPLVVINLVIYNGLYLLAFLLVPATVALLGKRAIPLLERLERSVDKFSAYVMPGLLGLAGLVLIADAVSFFVTGQGLI